MVLFSELFWKRLVSCIVGLGVATLKPSTETCNQLVMCVVPEIPRQGLLQADFRGIGLVDTLSKWYAAVLVLQLERWLRSHSTQRNREMLLYSYEPEVGCEHIITV